MSNISRPMSELKEGQRALILNYNGRIKFLGYRKGNVMLPIRYGAIPVSMCAGWVPLPKLK